MINKNSSKNNPSVTFNTGLLPDIKITGEHFKDNKIKAVSALGNDESLAEWLWNECKRISGFSYSGLVK